MKKIILAGILLMGFYSQDSYAQKKLATFLIEIPANQNGLEIPVTVNLDSITQLPADSLQLSEISGKKISVVPFQITKNETRLLTWMMSSQNLLTKRTYQLTKSAHDKFNKVEALSDSGRITIRSGKHNLLRYRFETMYPPAGIDTNYKRSGFIHPLWTPHGQSLTRIQPPDHYHHYGIWNPWTHTLFEKDTVDFWNIRGKTGTVRFAKFNSIVDGPIYAEFETLHEHVVFKKDSTEKIALNELQTIRVYHTSKENDYYVVDITSKMSCASDSPLLLLAYRYGGLGWRATEKWDKNNCEVLTSEGKTRKDTDGSKARWCIVQGNLDDDYGGAVMMSYPDNYNYPEPLRIWDQNANNNRGDMFANFSPTKDKDWLLEPGKTYTLKYRLLVFNGKMDSTKAEVAWQGFAKAPEVSIIKLK